MMAAIQASYPEKNIHDEVSDYYVAEEIASVYNGIDLILEPQDWKAFVTGSISEVSTFLLYLASNIELKKNSKNINAVPEKRHRLKISSKVSLIFQQ